MRPIDQLLPLQRLDTEQDGIDRRLNEIRAELLDRSAVQELETQLAEAAATTAAVEAEQLDLDLETEQLRTKLKEEEDKLYGGKSGLNPKELTALTHEVEQTKHLVASRDDRLIEILARLDEARGQHAAIMSSLDQLNEQRAARETELKNEARGLLRQQAEIKKEIEYARVDIDPAHLRQYDRLRAAKGGLAVAEIRQRICQGCRVALTTSEEHRLRGDALVTCSSCGRILYGVV
jgi:predicted  nucleic acid-binding Zn-ribbon protein